MVGSRYLEEGTLLSDSQKDPVWTTMVLLAMRCKMKSYSKQLQRNAQVEDGGLWPSFLTDNSFSCSATRWSPSGFTPHSSCHMNLIPSMIGIHNDLTVSPICYQI